MLGRSEIRVVEGQRRLGATDDGARQSSRLAQQLLGVEARRLQLGRGEAAAFLLGLHGRLRPQPERQSVVYGKIVSVREDLGGSRIIKTKNKIYRPHRQRPYVNEHTT